MSTAEQYELNKNLAQMLKGGVIMDVTTPEQAKIAEEAGACAVMALERIPADIRAAGGVSRMSDPQMIRGIQEAVSITGTWFPFGTDHGCTFTDTTECFTEIFGTADKRNLELVLIDMVDVIGRREHFTLVDIVDLDSL